MSRPPRPIEKTWGMMIYYELLNYVEDHHAIPDPYAFYRFVLLPKGYHLSRSGFTHWLARLDRAGLFVRCDTGAYKLKGVEFKIGVERTERDTVLKQFSVDEPIAYRGPIPIETIQTLYKSQRGKCWWCGCELLGVYHVDHRVPIAKGGQDNESNHCLACPTCNRKKGDKMPQEFNGRLL